MKTKNLDKLLEQEMAERTRGILQTPDKCSLCSAILNKKDKEALLSWQIMSYPNKIYLFCPECWAKKQIIPNENTST